MTCEMMGMGTEKTGEGVVKKILRAVDGRLSAPAALAAAAVAPPFPPSPPRALSSTIHTAEHTETLERRARTRCLVK
jgi:hypothetical protein